MNPSWFQPVNNYCERLSSAFWVWRRHKPLDWPALWLIDVTAIIGVGSFLFHIFADRWSPLADVLPIAVFIYSYFLLAPAPLSVPLDGSGHGIHSHLRSLQCQLRTFVVRTFPGVMLNGSVSCLPALVAMLAVGTVCRRAKVRQAGMELLWAVFTLALSLAFRSIDNAACSALPLGTHGLRHMLNALVLWILTITALAHALEERPLHGAR